MRKRLDFDRPVSHEVSVDLALQAPTGSNAQGRQWVFVEDLDKKKAIGDIYRTNGDPYFKQPNPDRGPQDARVLDSAKYLSVNLERVPVLLLPCAKGRQA